MRNSRLTQHGEEEDSKREVEVHDETLQEDLHVKEDQEGLSVLDLREEVDQEGNLDNLMLEEEVQLDNVHLGEL